jgi:xylulokinase
MKITVKEAYVIACDLGTGGCKSSLYDKEGNCIDGIFEEYSTYYPDERKHEQKPVDWLNAVKKSIKRLVKKLSPEVKAHIKGIGLSGHSLAMVPISKDGELLLDYVPIWSDFRADNTELNTLFDKVSEEDWYMTTGNGFPPRLYTVFKILWMKNHQPEIFNKAYKVIGSKDYINLMFTGNIVTDYSYASGTGIYNLKENDYSDVLLDAVGLYRDLFPKIVDSSDVVGNIIESLAIELDLPKTIKIIAGGVDNSCMALGSRCYKEGRVYNSLGSSSWIAVSSKQPLLDKNTKPYVFRHVIPNLCVSATAIFSAGSSYKWFAKILYGENNDPNYEELDKLAETISPGCEGLLFNPTLAGGSSLDKSPFIKGGFIGLSLLHTRAHLSRSVMEGVGFGLRETLDALRGSATINNSMMIVGGGSKSAVWRKILADILNVNILKSNIDQQAAALGAAALTLYGCGIWSDYSKLDNIHVIESIIEPDQDRVLLYNKLLKNYKKVSDFLSDYGDIIEEAKSE